MAAPVASELVINTVKDICGIDRSNDDFDKDLIPAINSVLAILHQEGLADEYYKVSKDNNLTWSQVLINAAEPEAISFIVEWVGLRTKLIFDPPTSSALMEALKENIAELEFRGFITNNYIGEIDGLYADAGDE